MSNLPNPAHPPWCVRGADCESSGGLHFSRLIGAAPRGEEVIQVGAALWQMDVGPVVPGGVLLEFSAGEDVERWPIDLAQAVALTHIMRRLIRTGAGLPRAA